MDGDAAGPGFPRHILTARNGSTSAVLVSGKPGEAAHRALTEACPATSPWKTAAGAAAGWVEESDGDGELLYAKSSGCPAMAGSARAPGTHGSICTSLEIQSPLWCGGVTVQPLSKRKWRHPLTLPWTWALAVPRVTSPRLPAAAAALLSRLHRQRGRAGPRQRDMSKEPTL